MTGDLSAMADHVTRLNELVVTTVGHANNNANLTLALLGTIFLPLTWIAGGRMCYFVRLSSCYVARTVFWVAHQQRQPHAGPAGTIYLLLKWIAGGWSCYYCGVVVLCCV